MKFNYLVYFNTVFINKVSDLEIYYIFILEAEDKIKVLIIGFPLNIY